MSFNDPHLLQIVVCRLVRHWKKGRYMSELIPLLAAWKRNARSAKPSSTVVRFPAQAHVVHKSHLLVRRMLSRIDES
ncbi:MAG: hypothetical protein VB817_01660, partial [Pirellulaceae bacterium]